MGGVRSHMRFDVCCDLRVLCTCTCGCSGCMCFCGVWVCVDVGGVCCVLGCSMLMRLFLMCGFLRACVAVVGCFDWFFDYI